MKLINLAILAIVLILHACGTTPTAPEKEVMVEEKVWTVEVTFFNGLVDTLELKGNRKPTLNSDGYLTSTDYSCIATNVILIKYLN